jgi:anti-sigma B factor antagonist
VEANDGVPFTVRVGSDGRLAVSGELDIATADRLQDAVRSVSSDRPGRVVLDLRGVSFMDSTGFAVLVNEQRRLETDGSVLVIAGASRQVLDVLRILAVESMFVMEHPAEADD